jgi:hypothetical protein
MRLSALPELVFNFDFDDSVAFEIEQKGWLEQVRCKLPDGREVPICFYDPVRLSQELEAEVALGKSFFAEPGLIVITRITIQHMQQAINELYAKGYFDHLVATHTA